MSKNYQFIKEKEKEILLKKKLVKLFSGKMCVYTVHSMHCTFPESKRKKKKLDARKEQEIFVSKRKWQPKPIEFHVVGFF